MQLARDNGFSSTTLRRVKQAAGVASRREGFGPGAVWKWERIQGADAKDEGGRMKDEPDKVCCNPQSAIRNPQSNVGAYGGNGPKSKVQGPKSGEEARIASSCRSPQSKIRNRTPQSNLSAYGEKTRETAEDGIGAHKGMRDEDEMKNAK